MTRAYSRPLPLQPSGECVRSVGPKSFPSRPSRSPRRKRALQAPTPSAKRSLALSSTHPAGSTHVSGRAGRRMSTFYAVVADSEKRRGPTSWAIIRTLWQGLPGWIQLLVLLFGGGVVGGAAVQLSNSSPTPTITTHTAPAPPTPPPPPPTIYLANAGASESNPTTAEDYGTGLATVGGASLTRSIRQLYGLSCCTESRSQTFSVPDRYTSFSARIGVGTGGNYDAQHTAAITFEVDVGGSNNRVFSRKLSYGDPAQRVVVSVRDQTVLILSTTTDDATCFTCDGEAVWGEAKLSP
jgi:hypothetical protein